MSKKPTYNKISDPLWPKLGVNIDHVATLRQLRSTPYPSLLEAAKLVKQGGGDQITIHLREDRRHIQDSDLDCLSKKSPLPINLEMAMTDSMVKIAIKAKPQWVCIVPEKRQELTTEGGLNVKAAQKKLRSCILRLKKSKIKVSLFIEPDLKTIELCHLLGADAIEIHTGRFCLAFQNKDQKSFKSEFKKIKDAALLGRKLGLRVHAGHGLDDQSVRTLTPLEDQNGPLIQEYNIGHYIICRSVSVGLACSVREMVSAILAP